MYFLASKVVLEVIFAVGTSPNAQYFESIRLTLSSPPLLSLVLPGIIISTQKLFGKRQLKSFRICCFRFVIFQRMRKKTGAPAFNHLSGCPLFPAFQESLTSLLAFGFLVIYFCNLFRGFLSYGTFAWVISFVGLQEAFFLQMGAPEVCRGVASRPCYLHSTIHNNIAIPVQYKIICNICQNSHTYIKNTAKNEGALHPVQWSGFALRMM